MENKNEKSVEEIKDLAKEIMDRIVSLGQEIKDLQDKCKSIFEKPE